LSIDELKNHGDFIPMISVEKCTNLLKRQVTTKKSLWDACLRHAYRTQDQILYENRNIANDNNDGWLSEEAAQCAFVKSLLTLWESIQHYIHDNSNDKRSTTDEANISKSLMETQNSLCEIIWNGFRRAGAATTNETGGAEIITCDLVSRDNLSQLGWINSTHSSILRFLSQYNHVHRPPNTPSSLSTVFETDATPSSISNLDTNSQLTRPFAFTLLGRLQHGEEHYAALLLSQDWLFLPDTPSDHTLSSASIPTALIQELVRTPQSKKQLRHSSCYASNRGIGPFGVETLKREAEHLPIAKKAESIAASEKSLLPLGKVWIWHMLSSTTVLELIPHPIEQQQSVEDTIAILSNCLQLIASMVPLKITRHQPQEASTCGKINHKDRISGNEGGMIQYMNSVSHGTKLYHLQNVCLFPESVVSDTRIDTFLVPLLQKYTLDMTFVTPNKIVQSSITTGLKNFDVVKDVMDELVYNFVTTCHDHSRPASTTNNKNKEEDLNPLTIGTTQSNTSYPNHHIHTSKKQRQSLSDFSNDIFDVYIEYGAQYQSFVYSLRFLLFTIPQHVTESCSMFTDIIKGKLRPVLHLLTTDEEATEIESWNVTNSTDMNTSIARVLEKSLSGGLPSFDQSRRDAPAMQDAIVTILEPCSQNRLQTVESGGFIYLWSIGTLARNLASSSQRCECGLEASRKRLMKLKSNFEIVTHVIEVAKLLLEATRVGIDSNNGAIKKTLVQIVLAVCCNQESNSLEDRSSQKLGDDVNHTTNDTLSNHSPFCLHWNTKNTSTANLANNAPTTVPWNIHDDDHWTFLIEWLQEK